MPPAPRGGNGAFAFAIAYSLFLIPYLSRMPSYDIDKLRNEDAMKLLINQWKQKLEAVYLGGGQKKIDKQHELGKLTARERIAQLIDPDTYSQEIGLLVAYDEYNGQAPAAAFW